MADSCHTYNITNYNCPDDSLQSCFDMSKEVSCQNGYVYDMDASDAFWSLASEYDWVCEKSELGSSVLVAQSIGVIVSTVVFMQLSDR